MFRIDQCGPVTVGYARNSRKDGNPELQVKDLLLAGCVDVVVEQGSGAKRDRPGLNEILLVLRPGDTLVVWKIDRLTRSLGDLIHILDDFQKRGIHLKAVHDPIDTTNPYGIALLQMVGVFAQLERGMLIQRTEAGLAVARDHGHVGGARRVLFGAKLKRALALLAQGLSQTEVAKAIGVSRATLIRYAVKDGRPAGKKQLDTFLKNHPNAEQWLKDSAVENYRNNPAKRAVAS